MVHARADYNRFQDPALNDPSLLGEGSSPIAEDEPVMLFRAKDRIATYALDAYAMALLRASARASDIAEANALLAMADVVGGHSDAMRAWQERNGSKTPDMPSPESTREGENAP